MKLYQELASLVIARKNCLQGNNTEWFEKHTEEIEKLVSEHMPSGGGFDSGTKLDLYSSIEDKLVFKTAYHHMAENGMYDGWTNHAVTVTPSLAFGFNIKISGKDRNQIKEYIAECFQWSLNEEFK